MMTNKLNKLQAIIALSLAIAATLAVAGSVYSLTIDNTVPKPRSDTDYGFGVSPEPESSFVLCVGGTIGLVAWVDYTDPDTGDHSWVDDCSIKFTSSDTKVIKVDGKKVTWHTTGEPGGSPGHTAPVTVSGEGLGKAEVIIDYYLPDGTYLGTLKPDYDVVGPIITGVVDWPEERYYFLNLQVVGEGYPDGLQVNCEGIFREKDLVAPDSDTGTATVVGGKWIVWLGRFAATDSTLIGLIVDVHASSTYGTVSCGDHYVHEIAPGGKKK